MHERPQVGKAMNTLDNSALVKWAVDNQQEFDAGDGYQYEAVLVCKLEALFTGKKLVDEKAVVLTPGEFPELACKCADSTGWTGYHDNRLPQCNICGLIVLDAIALTESQGKAPATEIIK